MTPRLALLPNPAAGGGRAERILPEVLSELDAIGIERRVVAAATLAEARIEAGRAAAAGEGVVAIGGDGLVGPVAGAMRGATAALTIVPAGRGNDFARVLRIPREPRAAVRLAVEGEERLLDVGEINGSAFVGIASLGFDSDANRIANESKLVRGNLVYLYAALRALAGWRHARFEVTVDGERHDVTGYSVAVANSKAYGGGMFVVPHAQLDDGRLDVLLVGEKSKLRFLRDIPKVFRGTHVEDPAARFLRGERVEVAADRPFTVYADGDPIAELPALVTVARRSLRVMTPPPAVPAAEAAAASAP
ncbi:MAG: diacylglycerol/lipid kinase family protein [Thermoleophilaceae bacterium]